MQRCIVAVVGGVIELKLRGKERIREILSLRDPVYKKFDIWAPKKAIPLWMKYQSDKKKNIIIFFSNTLKCVSVCTTSIYLAHPTHCGSGPLLCIQSVHTTACVRGSIKIRHESHGLATFQWF